MNADRQAAAVMINCYTANINELINKNVLQFCSLYKYFSQTYLLRCAAAAMSICEYFEKKSLESLKYNMHVLYVLCAIYRIENRIQWPMPIAETAFHTHRPRMQCFCRFCVGAYSFFFSFSVRFQKLA